MNSVVVPSTTISLEQTADVAVSAPPPSLAIGVGGEATHLVDRRSQSAAYLLVTPDFFTSIKAQIVAGRDFSDRDTATSQWVAIVNESAANRFWPGERAVGQRFRMTSVPDEQPREVIAVIRDIPLTRQGDLTPVVYASYLQQPSHYPQPGSNMFGQMMFLIRATGDPMSLVPGARRVVAEVDPDRPLAAVTTMRGRLGAAVPQRGYVVLTLSVFALTAMGLAAIGIYGVMAYTVAQRTREIGIRVAMGAKTREVMLLVGRRALVLVAIGLSIGLAGSLGLTRLLQSQLWGVTPTDPATFATVTAVFTLVALAAAFFPLRRATGVNPTIALRSE